MTANAGSATLNEDDFIAHLATFELGDEHLSTETLRLPTTGTLAYAAGLPPMEMRRDTNPEFRLGDTIGEGGMGVVRSAQQIALRREVAVKTLRDERKSEHARDGLLHEALISGGLEHPNIVPIYSLGQTANGDPVIVMKRIDGVAWLDYIAEPERIPDIDGTDSEAALAWHLDVFTQICRAVHYAHSRSVLHRDIKPENVMIGSFGEVYLVDWGIAASFDPDKDFLNQVVDTSGICGTPGYMAPEMTNGIGEEQGTHTDIFLLGSTLYHVLSGHEPFRGRTLFETMFAAHQAKIEPLPGVSQELLAVVRTAMAQAPPDRYESADALRRAVLDAQDHRASRMVCDIATSRLRELQHVVATSKVHAVDDAMVRGLAGACRFGFEQALRDWDDNDEASKGLEATLSALARWEIAAENVGPAKALIDAMREPSAELTADLEAVRVRIRERDASLEELRARSDDLDVSRAAGTRAKLAVISAAFWVTVPLLSGIWVRNGWGTVNPRSYLLHGLFVAALLMSMVVFMHRQVEQNHANRRLVWFVGCYAAWLPVVRLIEMAMGVDIVQALTLEIASYGLAIGAMAGMSDRRPYFPIAVYLAGTAGAAAWPYYVYEFIALSNFFGAGWIAWVWLKQERG